MESLARFPKIDAIDFLEMRVTNQNKNVQRSRKTCMKRCLICGLLSEAK